MIDLAAALGVATTTAEAPTTGAPEAAGDFAQALVAAGLVADAEGSVGDQTPTGDTDTTGDAEFAGADLAGAPIDSAELLSDTMPGDTMPGDGPTSTSAEIDATPAGPRQAETDATDRAIDARPDEPAAQAAPRTIGSESPLPPAAVPGAEATTTLSTGDDEQSVTGVADDASAETIDGADAAPADEAGSSADHTPRPLAAATGAPAATTSELTETATAVAADPALRVDRSVEPTGPAATAPSGATNERSTETDTGATPVPTEPGPSTGTHSATDVSAAQGAPTPLATGAARGETNASIPAERPVAATGTAPAGETTDVADAATSAPRPASAPVPITAPTPTAEAAALVSPVAADAAPLTTADVAEAASTPAPTGSREQVAPPPAQQIAEALREVRRLADGSHRLSLQLQPRELGTVQLEIALRNGQLHLHAVAESDATARTLEAALPELRSELRDAGVEAGSLEVRDHGTHARERERNQSDASTGATRPVPTNEPDPAGATDRPDRPSTSTLVDVRI